MTTTTTIDHAELQRRLQGPSDTPGDITAAAHWNSDRTGTVIYLGTFSRVEIGNDGILKFYSDGGSENFAVVGSGTTTDEVYKAARLFVKQHHVWDLTTRLLAQLDDVPSSVAHYAVEGARTPLAILRKQVYTVDFFHGR